MKNWKQCTLIVFMALLVFTFIGCGDDPCKCGAVDCSSTTKTYGYIVLDGGGGNIPIYRVKAVTEAQMDGVVAKVQAGYNGVNGVVKPKINTNNVNAIHITNDEWEIYELTSKIIKIPYIFTSDEMRVALQDIATYDIP